MHVSFVCVCQWKAQVSAALIHRVQTPRVWTACGARVPPTAHKHSCCCCLPRWQWSGRLQAAGSHAALSADTLSQLVNMFCRGNSLGKYNDRAKHKSAHIFVSLISWCDI